MARLRDVDVSLVAAVNNDAVLEACLARSPDVASGRLRLTSIRGANNMAQAYNCGMEQNADRVTFFAHQDVYLPEGWLDRALDVLDALDNEHPDWMVAGPYGVRANGRHVGRVWDVGLGRELGSAGFEPAPVVSLDELLLILKRSPDFGFDPALPHFHLYGTDVVQTCLASGGTAWALELPLVHNSLPVDSLGGGYAKAYGYVRRKWRNHLPIPTTVCPVSSNPLPLALARWRVRKAPPRQGKQLLADAVEVARAAGYEGLHRRAKGAADPAS